MLELKRYRFDYQSSKEDAARSLINALKSEADSIRAEVSPNKVSLYTKVPYWWSKRNMAPVFVAKFEKSVEGCALVGRFRPALDDAALSVIGGFIYMYFFFPSAWFLGLLAFVLCSSWIFQTEKRKKILNAIGRSI